MLPKYIAGQQSLPSSQTGRTCPFVALWGTLKYRTWSSCGGTDDKFIMITLFGENVDVWINGELIISGILTYEHVPLLKIELHFLIFLIKFAVVLWKQVRTFIFIEQLKVSHYYHMY